MSTVHKRTCVLRDLLEAALYIAADSPKAADRFLERAEQAFDTLLRAPEMGIALPSASAALPDLRRWSVPGFEKYLIFYRPVEDGIEVVRVLHGGRDVMAALAEE